MKILQITVFILFVFLFNSCDDTAELSDKELKSFKEDVLKTGNVHSYGRLLLHYRLVQNHYELLPYSIFMANKYQREDAYSEVYTDIIRISNNGKYSKELILNLDKRDQIFALSYLEEGAKKGDIDCKVFLADHYREGLGLPKNTKIADSIMVTIE
jgi:hypothetical protein